MMPYHSTTSCSCSERMVEQDEFDTSSSFPPTTIQTTTTTTTTMRRPQRQRRRRRRTIVVSSTMPSLSMTLIMYLAIISCCTTFPNNHKDRTLSFGVVGGIKMMAYGSVTTQKEDEESQKSTSSSSLKKNPQQQQQHRRRTDETTHEISKLVPTTTTNNNNNNNNNNATATNGHNHDTTNHATWDQILVRAAKRGLGGGLPGAVAGVVQVISLMWLRTIINYQTRYGTSLKRAITMLYSDGGIPRFYRGLPFALVQAPLSRFVSTAANDGVNTLLAALESTKDWGPGRTTILASMVVGLARILLMPIDTCKTVLQVNSAEGFRSLIRRVKAGKFHVLYEGAFATALSALVSHYPWFYTYNLLSKNAFVERAVSSALLRNAGIGLVASMVSDTMVNAFRVIKTTKQSIASKHAISYQETVSIILASGGWRGLFGRGLQTRILANAIQSIVFTVIWRGLADRNKNTTTSATITDTTTDTTTNAES